MSSFVLGEDTEAEDQLAALMDTAVDPSGADLQPTTSNDAEKEAEAALDSILETSVAEVNLALSHDDAVTAAVNAAALDATTNASSVVVVDEMAVTAAAAVAAAATDAAAEALTNNTLEVEVVSSETPLSTVPVTTVVATSDILGAATTTHVTTAAFPHPIPAPPARAGRWSLDEKILFLFGLQKFGKGHWKKISMYVPDRSLVQIKSHAQKVLKRIQSGENVFRRLEENVSRLHVLVTQIHNQLNLEPPKVLLQPTSTTFLSYNGLPGDLGTNNTAVSVSVPVANDKKQKSVVETNDADEADGVEKKRPRTDTDGNTNKQSSNGTEHIAASALCQLAGPEDEENEDGTEKVNDPVAVLEDNVIKTEDDMDMREMIGI